MEINNNWNKNNYSEKAVKLIDGLLKEMKNNPWDFDNKIVELSLTEDKKWVPLKIRQDKTYPNSYRVGLNNVAIYFDPIKPLDSIYFQKNLSMNTDDQDIIHKINQGADQFNLYSNGVSNFFIIDSDSTALKRYFDRTYNLNKKEYRPLTYTYRNNLKWGKDYITLNFLNYKLDKDYEKIKNDLLSRYEFNNKKRVDIVLMNFAIHYLCDDKEKLEKLCEFVDSVLFDDGIFIITYFDGDEILKNKKDNFSKIGPFNIEILREKENITIAKMPLPTIKSGDIYSEEPLVHKNMIKILENYLDLYTEYYIYDECKQYVDKIPKVKNFIEYYKLIKVGVYFRKKNKICNFFSYK